MFPVEGRGIGGGREAKRGPEIPANSTVIDGVMVHAELRFDQGVLQIGEINPAYGLVAAPEGDGDCYSLALYCADVDALVERAVAAGATVREPLADFVTGDRFASVRDPYGVRWSLMSRVEDLSEEESRRRVAQWAAKQQTQPSQ